MLRFSLLFIGLACLTGCAGGRERIVAEIERTIQDQAQAWNRGDIDGFMRSYAPTEELTMSASGRTTRGWQAILDGYKTRYPTRDEMGTLTFSELEIHPIGDGAAWALGRWAVGREPDPIGGNFTLVLLRTKDGWQIVHDHTSLRAD